MGKPWTRKSLTSLITKSVPRGKSKLVTADMQLSNNKLVDRGAKVAMQATGLEYEAAKHLLLHFGRVRGALQALGGG